MKEFFTDVFFIIGSIFSAIGFLFCAIALFIFIKMDAIIQSPYSRGDVTILPIVFGLMGACFLVIGAGLLFFRRRKKRMIGAVIDAGYYVVGTVTDVFENFSISVNRRHPYYIECRYKDEATDTLHVFRSRNIFYYPEDVIGKGVRIFVDRENFNHYYVDIERLLGKVEIH